MKLKSALLIICVLIAISDPPAASGAQFAGRKKYAEPHRERRSSHPSDEQDSVLFGELDQQDGKLNNTPADCYVLPAKAGQHVTVRYAGTDNSTLASLCLIIHGPDGVRIRETGEKSIECDLNISRNGKLFVALTTNHMGEPYGAYCLHVLGLDRPMKKIIQALTVREFPDITDSNRHPLKKDRGAWGDEKSNPTAIEFDLDKFEPGYLEYLIFTKVNQIRRARSLPAMAYSDILNRSARQHSEEMAELGYFSHESPVAAYATPDLRIRTVFRFMGRRTGENIGTQTFTGDRGHLNLSYEKLADDAMRMWMNSSGHRKQILSKDFSYLGVGCALAIDGDKISFYFTQNFGGM